MHHTYLNYGRGLDIYAKPQTPSNMRRSTEALEPAGPGLCISWFRRHHRYESLSTALVSSRAMSSSDRPKWWPIS